MEGLSPMKFLKRLFGNTPQEDITPPELKRLRQARQQRRQPPSHLLALWHFSRAIWYWFILPVVFARIVLEIGKASIRPMNR